MRRWVFVPFLLVATANAEPLAFHPIAPCRWVDTRENRCEVGSFVDPLTPCHTGALHDGETRLLNVQETEICGERSVPVGAKVLVLTVTAVAATGPGRLVLRDATTPRPGGSSVNFEPGVNRSNLVFVKLGQMQGQDLDTLFYPDTAVWARVSDGGTVHVTLDVLGYFR